jgi:glucosylceramidase
MSPKNWTRRQLLRSGLQLTAATAAASLTRTSAAQYGPPAPLNDLRLTFITTTESTPWQTAAPTVPTFAFENLNLAIDPTPSPQSPPMQGFGGCFNELGWTSLQSLPEPDRESILHELFDPSAGARFTYCRMPIAANDYATEAYSYDETPNDFNLDHFSIDHDRTTLIPFIHAAQRHQPNLRLWASPWSPPSWMKRNHFYAEAPSRPGITPNGIRPDQIGHEGEDMFIQEPRYFQAYAKYFARFIDAYRAENIPIHMVMPQNEFNSAQNFPSCTWTPAGLARFLTYLGPEMHAKDVKVFLGTVERGDPKLIEAVMSDPAAAPFVQGFGLQWAGKSALPKIHTEYPTLPIFQSEQECGDGSNSWHYTGYCWQLMKHYFRSGASGYMYWNISTAHGGISTWGWAQNSLIAVDAEAHTFRYTHDFYLLKHLTHFVDTGARRLDISGTCDDALAFLNPGGNIVTLLRNELPHPQTIVVQLPKLQVAVELPPDSIATLTFNPSGNRGVLL